MAEEFSGALVAERMRRLSESSVAWRMGVLTTAAATLERRMKERVSEGGAHRYGTPTTAVRGGGPAVVTGDLRRSITHQWDGEGTVRVGPSSMPHSVRGRGMGTTSGKIGLYLERGLSNGNRYPFVAPAASDTGVTTMPYWRGVWMAEIARTTRG